MSTWSREANNEALSQFYKAIELDPNFAAAYGLAMRCYARRKTAGWIVDRAYEIAEAARLARRAGELGRDDAMALCSAGVTLQFVVGDYDGAGAYIERALVLNPNLAWAWLAGAILKMSSEPEAAIERANRAMRLSPQDPHTFGMEIVVAQAHLCLGRDAMASEWAESALRRRPDFLVGACVCAAAGALAGRPEAASRAMERIRALAPDLRRGKLRGFLPFRRAEHFDRWAEGLRLAGLPE